MIRSSVAVTTGWLLGTLFILGMTFLLLPLFTDVPSPLSHMEEIASTLGASWFVVQLLITIAAGVLSGYVAATIAVDRPLLHGAGLAGIVVVLGLASVVSGSGLNPAWRDLTITAFGAAATVAGSYLVQQRRTAAGTP